MSEELYYKDDLNLMSDKVVEEFKLLEVEQADMSPKSIGAKEENQKWNW